MQLNPDAQNETTALQAIGESVVNASINNALVNPAAMNQLMKVARTFASSTMVPAVYAGNIGNCFLAVEMAARMNVSPMFVMQHLNIIQGRPSWSGAACIALIQGCKLFKGVRYVLSGEKGTPQRSCRIQAERVSDGSIVDGPVVSLQMATDEGWIGKNGSKWRTMPELMLRYRAAAFFARTECPNLLMGFQLDDEVRDVYGDDRQKEKITLEE